MMNLTQAKKLSVIGVSVKEGQKLTGVEQGPKLFREGGLLKAISELGYEIKDTEAVKND
jgi:arginase family enzyme